MIEKDGIRCATCKWCLRIDVGWSNWTVEDSIWHCIKSLNPGFPVPEGDNRDEWKEANLYAQKCQGFKFGCGPNIDVDQESHSEEIGFSNYCDDKEQSQLLNDYMKKVRKGIKKE